MPRLFAPPELTIDDCDEAIDVDPDFDDFGSLIDPCEESPSGQHEFSMADNFQRCIHCGEKSEA